MRSKWLCCSSMLNLLLLALWLAVSCSQSKSVDGLDFLDEIQIGYVMYTTRYKPQPMLVSREQGKFATKHFNIKMTCPSWSPDYDRLAYAEEGNIYIHSVEQITSTIVETNFFELSAPVWSPNGDSLVFSAKKYADRGGLDIWRLDLFDGDLQLLVPCTSSASLVDSCSSPAWLPDGRLSYVRHIGYDPDTGMLSNIEVLSLSTLETEILATGLPIYRGWAPFGTEEQFYYDHYSALAWSPDGSHVAFSGGSNHSDDRNIYILETASKDISAIFPTNTYADSPVWLDGTHLVFRSEARPDFWEEGSHTEAYNIAIVDIHNKEVTKLTDFEPLHIGDMSSNPVISCPFWIPRTVGEVLSNIME